MQQEIKEEAKAEVPEEPEKAEEQLHGMREKDLEPEDEIRTDQHPEAVPEPAKTEEKAVPYHGVKENESYLPDEEPEQDILLQKEPENKQTAARPEKHVPSGKRAAASSLPDCEQWFRSLEWQLRSRGIDPASVHLTCTEEGGEIQVLAKKSQNAVNFMNAGEDLKKNLYRRAAENGFHLKNVKNSLEFFISKAEDSNEAVVQKNDLLAEDHQTEIPERASFRELADYECADYQKELIRLAEELHKTDSRFSKDSPAYQNLRAELTYITEEMKEKVTLGSEELQQRTEAIARYCQQYMDDHKKFADFSSRQLSRMKTMNRLMDLNCFCHDIFLKNPEGETVLDETQMRIALKIVQNKAIFLNKNPLQCKETGHLRSESFSRKCLLNHEKAWEAAESLAETSAFKTLTNNNLFDTEHILRSDGQKVFRKYMFYFNNEKEMYEDGKVTRRPEQGTFKEMQKRKQEMKKFAKSVGMDISLKASAM